MSASATPIAARLLRNSLTPSTRFQVLRRGSGFVVRDTEHAVYFGSWPTKAGADAYAAHRNSREDDIMQSWAERQVAAITEKMGAR